MKNHKKSKSKILTNAISVLPSLLMSQGMFLVIMLKTKTGIKREPTMDKRQKFFEVLEVGENYGEIIRI